MHATSISTIQVPQTYALARAANGTGIGSVSLPKINFESHQFGFCKPK
jgi:hypothetical protein